MTTELTWQAIAVPLIQHYEECSLRPYQKLDRPTIGWGNTFWQDGRAVTMADKEITQEEANALFEFFLDKFAEGVINFAPGANANELAAFISLSYNIGLSAFTRSSALREYLRSDKMRAGQGIELYDQSEGRILKGLQRRRRAEHYVFDGVDVASALEKAETDYP